MRSRQPRPLLLAALACLLLAGQRARAADNNTPDAKDGKPQVVVALQSGAHVRIRTESDPPGDPEALSNFVEAEERPNLIRRVFVDKRDELFFGYELLVERVGDSKQFRVAVRPLSEEYLKQLAARPAFQKRRLHPSYNPAAFSTAPQTVGDGDTFALDVLRNPRTGAKIVDLIQVSLSDAAPDEAGAGEPPRDFALEDVSLQVKNYELLIDGESVYKSPGGSLSGPLIWLALRGRGRFVFSLVPRPGYEFQKTARLEQNRITFDWGGERFEWVSSEPVVGLGGNWNLWVMHDPDYDFDLFDQSPARPASDPTFAQKAEEAARQMRGRNSQAGYGSNSSAAQQPAPKRARQRTRVIIGAADAVSDLFPK
ncbi:MAG TPA: hypothetical protein VE642_01790 [Pyrinomonadaceae bacterium]|nr:hypothetical protein [Pyrinomonadaceae bacterium]